MRKEEVGVETLWATMEKLPRCALSQDHEQVRYAACAAAESRESPSIARTTRKPWHIDKIEKGNHPHLCRSTLATLRSCYSHWETMAAFRTDAHDGLGCAFLWLRVWRCTNKRQSPAGAVRRLHARPPAGIRDTVDAQVIACANRTQKNRRRNTTPARNRFAKNHKPAVMLKPAPVFGYLARNSGPLKPLTEESPKATLVRDLPPCQN